MPGELLRISRDLRITRTGDQARCHRRRGPDLSGACQRFDALFEPTVASSIDPQRPSGLLLSGGLDSALICSALTRPRTRLYRPSRWPTTLPRSATNWPTRSAFQRCSAPGTASSRLSQEALWQRIAWMVWRTDELMDDPPGAAHLVGVGPASTRPRNLYRRGADDVFAGDGCYRRQAFQRYFSSLIAPGSGGWRSLVRGARTKLGAVWRGSARTRRSAREDIVTGWPRHRASGAG